MTDLVEALRFPFANIPEAAQVMIVTDTAIDPDIWQAMIEVIGDRGAEATVMLYRPRAHHTAEPPPPVFAALPKSQFCVYLTSTALAHSEFWESRGSVGVLLMEEATPEILLSPGCRLDPHDWRQIVERGRRIRRLWIEGGDVRVTSPAGTDLRAQLEPGHRRNADTVDVLFQVVDGKGLPGTWPYGENRVTPIEGTGEGQIVWDVCAHHPDGRFSTPVTVTVEGGQAVRFEGGPEAEEIKRYLELHGDANVYNAPAEISLGTNHRASIMGQVRNDKKVLGTAHIAIGRSDIGGTVVSNIHFDGVISKPTIELNGRVVVKDGHLLDEASNNDIVSA